MNVFFDESTGLTIRPEGVFNQSMHAPLTAHMAEHLFLWSKITLDFSEIEEIDDKGFLLLKKLSDKVQDPKQKIIISNLSFNLYAKLVDAQMSKLFFLEKYTQRTVA